MKLGVLEVAKSFLTERNCSLKVLVNSNGESKFLTKIILVTIWSLGKKIGASLLIVGFQVYFFLILVEKIKMLFQVTAETSSFKPNFFVRNLITNEEESFEDNYKLEVLNGEWLREKTDSEGRTILHIPNFQEIF